MSSGRQGSVAVLVLVGLDNPPVIVAVARKAIVQILEPNYLGSRIQRVDDRTVPDNHHFLDLVRSTEIRHDPRLTFDLDLLSHKVIVDLEIQRGLRAEENVAVGVGSIVAVVHQLGVGANHAVVAGDELQETQDGTLVHDTEDKGRGGLQQGLLGFLTETDEALFEVSRPGMPDLPDVEVDETHGEHVIGKEGELVLTVDVVGLEGVPQKLDVLLLFRGLEGER